MLNYYTDTELEKEILSAAESKLKGISRLFRNKKVLIAEGKRKEIFLLSPELFETYQKIKSKKHPFSAGFFFGEYSSGNLKFSLEAVYEYAKFSDYHKIKINRKFEQKFLYGRNPGSDVVTSYDPGLSRGDTAVVCNALNEALGIGVITGELKSKRKTRAIKNIMDRGWYLRHRE